MRRRLLSKGEQAALELLARVGTKTIPTPVDAIAKALGAMITYEALDRDIAGILFRDDKRTVIGVNSAHAVVRQRFTIAHELGHLQLHKGHSVHVDRVRVNFRDVNSSTAHDREEIAANAFAAALLMPPELVVETVAQYMQKAPGLTIDELTESLSERFRVSRQAMEYRLKNLGFISPW
jgi:Zn-dependent peptidase ImmA (M78 family)